MSIKDNEGISALDLLQKLGLNFKQLADEIAQHEDANPFPLLEAPTPFAADCCYTSLMICKNSMQSTELLKRPFLTVTLYKCTSGKSGLSSDVVEVPQAVSVPSITRMDYLWWGCVIHLQIPLQNLVNTGSGKVKQDKNGSASAAESTNTLVLFELKDAMDAGTSLPQPPPKGKASVGSGGPGKCIAWTVLDITKATIDTRDNQQLQMHEYPIDLRRKALVSADMFLSVDVMMERLEQGDDGAAQESSARGSISMLRHGRAISNVAGKLTHLVDKYSSGQMTEKDFNLAKQELLRMKK